jgi:hypothetical protein
MKLSGESAQAYRIALIFKLRAEGGTQESIAALVQCSQCWVSKVLHRADSPDSDSVNPLKVGHALGQPCHLSDLQLESLKLMLCEGL